MARIWSDEGKLATWLEVELAATAAWAELGVVPEEAAAAHRRDDPAERGARGRARGDPPPRHRRVRRRRRRAARRGGPLVPLRPHLLGRRRHRAFAADARGGRADPRGSRPRVRRRHRPRRGAPRDAADRPHARRPRRADDLRAQARRLGIRARARSRAGRAGARGDARRQALGRRRHLRRDRSRARALACERLGLEPAPTSTQILQRDRHAELLTALAVVASSLDSFALEIRHLARTEVGEVQEPFGRGQKGSSAMPHKRNPVVAERICGLARVVRACALVGLENVALWHERDISHSSAERVVDSRRIPRARLHARPLRLARGGPRRAARADAPQPRGEPLPLLQPARAATRSSSRASHATTPTGSCSARDARLGGGARLPRALPHRRRDRLARRPRLGLRPHRVHAPRRHRLRPSRSSQGGAASMPETHTRVRKGPRASTRSTTSACCSSHPTGSRPSTSSCRPRSRTRDVS